MRGRFHRVRTWMMQLAREVLAREWRYQSSWILLCGRRGSGRTALLDSIQSGRKEQPSPRESALQFSGTRWRFFSGGVLIDVEAECLPDPETDDRRWNQTLGELIDRRPERALDGVVLVICGQTLLANDRAALQSLADDCFLQISTLQQQCEFQLPVYVIVTRCDSIPGYVEFWRAQPGALREQICGWSNPCALDNLYASDYLDQAFDYVGGVLKALQLQAAASDRRIGNADDFFLAPQRFQSLREPLRNVLSYVFRPSAYRAAPFFRGVYFTAAVDDPAEKLAGRNDISFVDQLFREKVFAEQNLARPLRQAVLSRNVITRWLQLGSVMLASLLILGLSIEDGRLRQQVEVAASSAKLIQKSEATSLSAGDCTPQATVYQLLANVSLLDVRVSSPVIPVSWLPWHPDDRNVHLVARSAFEKVIFPALACELRNRTKRLLQSGVLVHSEDDSPEEDRARLTQYLDELLALEQAKRWYGNLAAAGDYAQAGDLESQLESLAQYLYGAPVPSSIRFSRDYYFRALAEATGDNSGLTAHSIQAEVLQQLRPWCLRALAEIQGQIKKGQQYLEDLADDRRTPLENTQRFDHWLRKIRADWSAATATHNPCAELASALRGKLTRLKSDFGYDQLPPILKDFAPSRCYDTAAEDLGALTAAPVGKMFERRQPDAGAAGAQGPWELTPGMRVEADGLARIIGLDVMQLKPAQPFSCQQPLQGWRLDKLQETLKYARQYDEFAAAQMLDDSRGALPLYAQVLRRQLQSVLDDGMRTAQITSAALSNVSVDAIDSLAASEQALANQSNDLQRLYPALIQILGEYQQLGFDSTLRVTQCARRYALDALQRLAVLTQASGLYNVGPAETAEADGGKLFGLGGRPEVTDYLQTQLQRAQVLAAYSRPFVTVLQNTDGMGDPFMPPGATASYWDKTVQEVNRNLQFKEPNGQVAVLGDFIQNQMAVLTLDNCHQKLSSYVSPAYGNDLFSMRRQGLSVAADVACSGDDRQAAFEQYKGLAVRFGKDIGGRFPFAAAGATAEASLLQTRDFFEDYASERESLRRRLSWLKPRQGLAEVAQFLDRLDSDSRLLVPGNFGADALTPVHIKLEFRALTEQSAGTQNIVSWRLQIPDTAPAPSYPNGPTELDWHFGQPVSFVGTWADLSTVSPQADPQQSDLHIEGRTATFAATGAWALFKLIQQHPPASGVSLATVPQGAAVLEFEVPTLDSKNPTAQTRSRFYVLLQLSVRDPKTQALVATAWPGSFAMYAPTVW